MGATDLRCRCNAGGMKLVLGMMAGRTWLNDDTGGANDITEDAKQQRANAML